MRRSANEIYSAPVFKIETKDDGRVSGFVKSNPSITAEGSDEQQVIGRLKDKAYKAWVEGTLEKPLKEKIDWL